MPCIYPGPEMSLKLSLERVTDKKTFSFILVDNMWSIQAKECEPKMDPSTKVNAGRL